MSAPAQSAIDRNVAAYRGLHRAYEQRHPEIFNALEQERLRAALSEALAAVRTGADPPRVLDMGCGSGNLTGHLLELGAHVVAADVSPDFLALVAERHAQTGRLETFLLNGRDLEGLPDGSLDMVAAYSVLHHIPDYLGALDEAGRVLAPGGVVYLDHEASEASWSQPPALREFHAELVRARRATSTWRRFITPAKYRQALIHLRDAIRLRMNPRYQAEGDIHVFPDDHVEWDRVVERLGRHGIRLLRREDYLLFRADYDAEVYARWRERCSDTTLLIARKEPASSGGA